MDAALGLQRGLVFAINRSDMKPSIGLYNILLNAFALRITVADLKLCIRNAVLGRA